MRRHRVAFALLAIVLFSSPFVLALPATSPATTRAVRAARSPAPAPRSLPGKGREHRTFNIEHRMPNERALTLILSRSTERGNQKWQWREIRLDELGLRQRMHATLGRVEQPQGVTRHQLGMGFAETVGGGTWEGYAIRAHDRGDEVKERVRCGLVVSRCRALRDFVRGVVTLDAGTDSA